MQERILEFIKDSGRIRLPLIVDGLKGEIYEKDVRIQTWLLVDKGKVAVDDDFMFYVTNDNKS